MGANHFPQHTGESRQGRHGYLFCRRNSNLNWTRRNKYVNFSVRNLQQPKRFAWDARLN